MVALELLERVCRITDELKDRMKTIERELQQQMKQGTRKGRMLAVEFLTTLDMTDQQVEEYKRKK